MPMLLMVENAVGLGLQTLGLGMLMVLGIIALLYIILKILKTSRLLCLSICLSVKIFLLNIIFDNLSFIFIIYSTSLPNQIDL